MDARPDAPLLTLSDRLAHARGLAGLSQPELSRLAGLVRDHVRQMEAGGSEPNARTLRRLTGVLGVSLDWLVLGTGDAPTEEQVKEAVRAVRERASDDAPPATGTDGR